MVIKEFTLTYNHHNNDILNGLLLQQKEFYTKLSYWGVFGSETQTLSLKVVARPYDRIIIGL